MLYTLESFIQYFRVHGFVGGFQYLLNLIGTGDECVYVFDLDQIDLLKNVAINQNAAFSLQKEIEPNKQIYQEFINVKGKNKARKDIERYRRNRDNVAIITINNSLAGWGIISDKKQGESSKPSCLIHSCVTLRKFRRNRVYVSLLCNTLKKLKQEGYEFAFITSKIFNRASIGAIEKVGFKYVRLEKNGSLLERLFRHFAKTG